MVVAIERPDGPDGKTVDALPTSAMDEMELGPPGFCRDKRR
jgi:hypothetical protein